MINILFCSKNASMAQGIVRHLDGEDVNTIKASIARFNDGEIAVELQSNVRDQVVFVVQSCTHKPNDDLMELLIVVDALKRASAAKIVAVIPYFYYARQDRKSSPRSPITAKLCANLLQTAGVNSVITMDLHVSQIQGFFDIPVDNIYYWPCIINHIKDTLFVGEDLIITAPDVGGIVRARSLAKRLSAQMAIIDKRREKAGISEVMNIIGDVSGKDCIITDDILDSGGTLCNAADALKQKGARSVSAYITHGLFSGAAVSKIEGSALDFVAVSDTVENEVKITGSSKIKIISAAEIFSEVISELANGGSVSKLFD